MRSRHYRYEGTASCLAHARFLMSRTTRHDTQTGRPRALEATTPLSITRRTHQSSSLHPSSVLPPGIHSSKSTCRIPRLFSPLAPLAPLALTLAAAVARQAVRAGSFRSLRQTSLLPAGSRHQLRASASTTGDLRMTPTWRRVVTRRSSVVQHSVVQQRPRKPRVRLNILSPSLFSRRDFPVARSPSRLVPRQSCVQSSDWAAGRLHRDPHRRDLAA